LGLLLKHSSGQANTEYLYINSRLGGLEMKLNLFQEVVVNCDFPELKIAAGDIAILNDYVIDQARPEVCVLEI
jgi:hypothetical protein